jgi:hypothetical protein
VLTDFSSIIVLCRLWRLRPTRKQKKQLTLQAIRRHANASMTSMAVASKRQQQLQ